MLVGAVRDVVKAGDVVDGEEACCEKICSRSGSQSIPICATTVDLLQWIL